MITWRRPRRRTRNPPPGEPVNPPRNLPWRPTRNPPSSSEVAMASICKYQHRHQKPSVDFDSTSIRRECQIYVVARFFAIWTVYDPLTLYMLNCKAAKSPWIFGARVWSPIDFQCRGLPEISRVTWQLWDWWRITIYLYFIWFIGTDKSKWLKSFPVEDKEPFKLHDSWWRDQMETFSALLALCEGN